VPAEPKRPAGLKRAGLFFLAFGSGFAILTIEIAGARLIAPAFGLSAVPWTAVIGVILAAIALGSHLGGRLADARSVPLSAVLVASAFTAALPVLGGGVPGVARAYLGFIPGAIASAIVLFAPAVLCLGAVVPYLVQADTETLGSVGRRAGDVSAAATAGSIAGSFMTGFVLLPAFPLPVLLGLTAVALLLMAALAGWILGGRVPAGLTVFGAIGLGVLGFAGTQLPPGVLHREQTLYAFVEVIESDWGDGSIVRELRQNGGSSSAEYVTTGDPAHSYAIASGLILEPVIERVESMLVLGGAALSLPAAMNRWRPDLVIDVVEIDPVVTQLAEEYFEWEPAAYPNLTVHHEDARLFLRRAEQSYDVIYLDVFDHLLTVPWTMVTVEALSEMADAMEPDGLFMANVLSPLDGAGLAFLERFQATLLEVFPHYVIYRAQPEWDVGTTQNLIVVATRDEDALPIADWEVAVTGPAGRPLTDDWAPVEYLQSKVFLEGLGWN